MLEEIRIHGLGVIDDALLELDRGFTVVTGETGAGKTMVVTGLSLLLGTRADAGLVRAGAQRAVVEGRLRLEPDSASAQLAGDAGAELDEDTLIVVRTVGAEGRSRAHIGGTSVPVKLLGDLAEQLVALHGQSEQLQLLRPTRQREVLDRYAGDPVLQPLRAYRGSYDHLMAVTAELEELRTQARERAREADALRYGLAEIEAVEPVAGEEEELVAEEERLAHADTLRSAAEAARTTLAGDEEPGSGAVDALSALGAARRALDGAREHDPVLAALADRVAEASFLVSDVAADLASYADGIETDPLRLQAVGERRAALATLTRKYGDAAADVLAWAESAAKRLIELEGSDERIASLRDERSQLQAELGEFAGSVSAARAEAARRFGTEVTTELGALAMPHATLSVEVSQTPAPDPGSDGERATGDEGAGAEESAGGLRVGDRVLAYGPYGVDDVELQLCPHPGAPARAVQRGASGGELSRVMLAVEVVLAGVDRVPTFVFDEIDAGVGGKAAVEIGRRLARLARHAQVVVVTHLPQVAAFADRHYLVRKSSDGAVTRSGLVRLDSDDRIDELARMLAGLEESASARTHAQELLATAAADRDKPGTRRSSAKRRATKKITPGQRK